MNEIYLKLKTIARLKALDRIGKILLLLHFKKKLSLSHITTADVKGILDSYYLFEIMVAIIGFFSICYDLCSLKMMFFELSHRNLT